MSTGKNNKNSHRKMAIYFIFNNVSKCQKLELSYQKIQSIWIKRKAKFQNSVVYKRFASNSYIQMLRKQDLTTIMQANDSLNKLQCHSCIRQNSIQAIQSTKR